MNKRCPKCQKEVSEEVMFCPYCGTNIEKEPVKLKIDESTLDLESPKTVAENVSQIEKNTKESRFQKWLHNMKIPKTIFFSFIAIITTFFISFIAIIFIGNIINLLVGNNNSNSNLDNPSVQAEESKENKLKKEIKKNLNQDYQLKKIELNPENQKYDITINYLKTGQDLYSCTQDTIPIARKLQSLELNNIEFTCENESGTFNTIKIENINSVPNNNIESSLKFYDLNGQIMDTNLQKLEEDHIKNYKASAKNLNYKDVLRYPDNYKGQRAYWFGEIAQVVTNSTLKQYRVNVSCEKYTYINDYSCPDTIYVSYLGEGSFIEDDMVKMWGIMDGTVTYTAVLGNSITIPSFNALYIELQ